MELMRGLKELADDYGVTERQAYFWAAQGYLRVTWFKGERELLEPPKEHRGINARLDELAQLHFAWMVQCVKAGFAPERSTVLASSLAAGAGAIQISDELVLLRGRPMGDVDAVHTL